MSKNNSFVLSGPKDDSDIPKTSVGKIAFNSLKRRNPESVVNIDAVTGNVLTCQQLLEDSVKLTTVLRSLQLKRGDVIAISSENTLNYAVPVLSGFYMGVAVNLLNPAYSSGELKHALLMSKPKVIFSSEKALNTVLIVKKELECIEKVFLMGSQSEINSEIKNIGDILEGTYASVNHFQPDEFDAASVVALIMLSSGTTGLPKGVQLTHLNMRSPLIHLSCSASGLNRYVEAMSKELNVLYGPKSLVPLEKGTIGQQLYDALLRNANLPEAMINAHTDEKISYRTILETTCRLALSLRKCGYTQNSVIAVCSENNLNFFYPVIAALYLGIITAPLNENYTERELYNALNISKPRLIFCSKQSTHKVLLLKEKFPFIQKIIVLDSKENINGVESMYNFISRNSDANFNVRNFKPIDFDAEGQVALIMCSSGTTGLPKGVMLTHRNISVRFTHCSDPLIGIITIPETTVLSFMPFFHAFGLITTLGYFVFGLRVVIMQRFEPELFLRSLQNYKVRSTLVVPPVILLLAKSPLVDKYNLSSLEELGCAAAPLSTEITEIVTRRLNLQEIRQAYGLTEATSGVLLTISNEFRPGSCGKVVPFMQAKVVDIDTHKALGPKQNGELCFKGDMVMKGYANNIDATKNTIDQDGWLHTGDIGYYDEEENFYIVDRLKDLIKYKGFQVPPAELEALLLQHPSIKDAGVVGIPDELAGELPMAFVVKQSGKKVTEQEVLAYIASQVSSAKRLRGGVRFVDELPKNATGKILKRELRELARKQMSKL